MQYSQNDQDTQYQKRRKPISIAIVTNNPQGWDPMANLFRHEGFEADVTADAEELNRTLLENRKPNLLVIDVQKRRARDQGPNGFQIASLLKEAGPCVDVPLLLIDDAFKDSMTDSFFTQPGVTARRYGEPRIHRHVIKKLLQTKTQDHPRSSSVN